MEEGLRATHVQSPSIYSVCTMALPAMVVVHTLL